MLETLVWRLALYLAVFYKVSFAIDTDDDEGITVRHYRAINVEDDEPVTPIISRLRFESRRNINCENFSDYALNCTMNAATMYNSNKKSPPPPPKMDDWCKAVRYLTNCALEWNLDCQEVTDSRFNEETINGHSYVVHNICDDKRFLDHYAELSECVDGAADDWEVCYTTFKNLVDGYKTNTTSEWTHYETHFYLCCGRASFRRCVLDSVFSRMDICTKSQAMVLQKFSVIISEGDVYQDCEFNMIYENCPGGDPRPNPNSMTGLASMSDFHVDSIDSSHIVKYPSPYCTLLIYILLLWNIF